MGWPYDFPDLTKSEKLERRQILDLWGLIAQISVIIPLLLAFILSCIGPWLSRRQQGRTEEGISSPRLKQETQDRNLSIASLLRRWRKIQWWLGDDLVVFRYRLGTKGEVLGAATWTTWLLVCSSLQTGRDYFHLTKRFGTIAASQLPLQYLLAIKSPYSPLQKLTGTSYETINVAHQLLGRIITILLYLHAALYLNFYILNGLVGDKLQQFYIICGIVGVIAFTAIGTTALSPIRHWSYRVFYLTHITLATLLLPILFLHVTHIRIYIYETAALYALNALLRTLATATHNATLKLLPGTNLLEITLQTSKTFQPGQHAYLSLPGNPLLRTLNSNPFTLAVLPTLSTGLKFLARVRSGNTTNLARLASKSTPDSIQNQQRLKLEGPYGLPTHSEKLLSYPRVLFVAGGAGGTFIAPLYRHLLADLSPGKGSYRRGKVSFVWVVKGLGDVGWALPEPLDTGEREGFVERLRVFVTSAGGGPAVRGGGLGVSGGGEEGFELEEREGLLPAEGDGDADKVGSKDLVVHTGRPDLKRVASETFSHGSDERVAVVVCGPSGLSEALRREVRPWVMEHGRDVWFWDEAFGL